MPAAGKISLRLGCLTPEGARGQPGSRVDGAQAHRPPAAGPRLPDLSVTALSICLHGPRRTFLAPFQHQCRALGQEAGGTGEGLGFQVRRAREEEEREEQSGGGSQGERAGRAGGVGERGKSG